jgi:hypothetical protein
MNRIILIILLLSLLTGCKKHAKQSQRIPVAEINNMVLYFDEIPNLIQKGINESDSTAIVQNYINKWAKRQLMLGKAEENLSPQLKTEIENQMQETRTNLLIYQYQREMMLQKMDTIVSDQEMEKYFNTNEKSLLLNENIVKALFIKLPRETPDLEKIRRLAKSSLQSDLQQLESICYQFAEKFDDFSEKWIPMSRLRVELQQEIGDEESFLRSYKFFETSDQSTVYLISIRDYRLRSTLAPFDYVKEDIRRIIWNTRRYEFIQALENGIYDDAVKKKSFKIF